VRDELLGLPVQDKDFVVVGATPEEMVAAGFKPVGKDFPVFLHPKTHEEHALARTERKSGRGYKGFTVHSAPDVTLEQDLARRDLTINAIAKSADGKLIDPYHGEKDLREGVLRHVSEAFAEDPVRILRVARFAARFSFRIADETMGLMTMMVTAGETDHLVPERVWQEFSKGLAEPHPELMFEALERCGLRAKLLPELKSVPKTFSGPLPGRFTVLCWPLQEAEIKDLCERLRVPNDERELALLACRTKSLLNSSQAGDLLNLFKRADALRRPERFALLLEAAGLAQPGFDLARIDKALAAASAVDAGDIARRASAPAAISALLDQAREQAIAAVL
jgi:tRNA nucleotidyltransferase (CCA-adding enzyme)